LLVAIDIEAGNTATKHMSDLKPDENLLLIRCPSCGQRFKVGEDLRGRTVECGGCEHRFRINDQVIVRGKKFYPGEKHDERLHHFQRVPLAVAPPLVGAQAVRYADPPDSAVYEPAKPQQIVAGIIGVCGMALMALLLMFGARSGGMLDGMITQNRLMMAGFTGLLGTALLLYANPRARGKALVVGLLLSAGLVSLPFFFTTGSTPLVATREAPARDLFEEALAPDSEAAANAEPAQITELRSAIGTDPLVAEIQRLAAAGSNRRAVGLWLRDLREQHRFLIREYILRATGADPQSHYYPRGYGDFLMVVTGISQSLEEVARIAAPLGSVEHVYQEISVIEVKVNNENFVEGPIEKLTDRNNPGFYDLNKRELESIDLKRVERAVKRLAEAEPKVYRSDIAQRLLTLLTMPDVTFKGDICHALEVWSTEPGPAGEAALREVRQFIAKGVSVPVEMISLIVAENTPGLAPVVHELWEQNPNQWEMPYARVGAAAEPALLRIFPTAEGSRLHSAVRVLGRVGGADSLPILEAALAGADPELRVLLENAIGSIRRRLGN
jgi:hypothetical protein